VVYIEKFFRVLWLRIRRDFNYVIHLLMKSVRNIWHLDFRVNIIIHQYLGCSHRIFDGEGSISFWMNGGILGGVLKVFFKSLVKFKSFLYLEGGGLGVKMNTTQIEIYFNCFNKPNFQNGIMDSYLAAFKLPTLEQVSDTLIKIIKISIFLRFLQ